MDKKNSGGGGISFVGLLTIVFITLKLTHVIAWGTGISGTDFYAGFIGAARNGFVAGEQNSIQCDYHLSAKCFYAIRTN